MDVLDGPAIGRGGVPLADFFGDDEAESLEAVGVSGRLDTVELFRGGFLRLVNIAYGMS